MNKQLYKIIFSTVILVAVGCNLKPPASPTWEPTVNIPLIHKSYAIEDFARHDNIHADTTGNLYFETFQVIPENQIGDRIKLNAFGKQKIVKGPQLISPFLYYDKVSYELPDVYQVPDSTGDKAVIPSFQIDGPSKNLTKISNLKKVVLDKGRLTIKVESNFEFDLDSPFIVRVVNKNGGNEIGAIEFGDEIISGASVEKSIDLPNAVLENQLQVKIYGSTKGSNDMAVPVDENTLSVTVSITDVIINEFTFENPEYDTSYRDSLAFSDSLAIQEAWIKSGSLSLKFKNDFDVKITVTLNLPNVFNSNGEIFNEKIELVPDQEINRDIPLAGLVVRAGEQNELEKLDVIWKIKLSGADETAIKRFDSISSSISLSQIVFSKLLGKLYRIKVPIIEVEKSLDLPSEIDSVRLANTSLVFNLEYTIGFYIETRFKLIAVNDDGLTEQIDINVVLPPNVDELNAVVIPIENIAPMFNIIPSRLILSGQILVGQRKRVNQITENDFIQGQMDIKVPLRFVLPSQHVKSEIRSVYLSDDVQDMLEKRIVSGNVYLEIENHLPFAPEINVYLASRADSIYGENDFLLSKIKLVRPVYDPAIGKVINPSTIKTTIELDEQKLPLFQQTPFYVGLEILWSGSLGQYIALYQKDYLKVSAHSSILVKAGRDD